MPTDAIHYLPISENITRQLIDSAAVFDEWSRVREQSRPYEGSMYFKAEGGYEYLVKTRLGKRSAQRLGRRDEASEKICEAYTAQKQKIESRLKALQVSLNDMQRMNKALRVGRVPTVVVDVLEALAAEGLSQHFTVVGTHALYAYETAAQVRITSEALATRDIDLLWDARKRLQFIADMERLDTSLIRLLQKADASFERKTMQNETAINASGFEVDFIRRQPVDGDPHPFRFSKDEDDLWPVQARRAAVLTSAPRFEQIVIATNGSMARMNTVSPQTFVEFKSWMAKAAPDRAAARQRRDALQAKIVQVLLDEGLLHSQASGR
jgi:hypothetical protein